MKRIILLLLAMNWIYGQSPVGSVGSGCALEFDGVNDYVKFSNAGMGITNKVTVSAWVKTSTNAYKWIVGKYSPFEDAGWHLYINAGKFYLAGRDGSGNYRSVASSTSTFADGKWHHVVGVIDNNIWRIYVDGILQGTLNTGYTATNLQTTASLEVGRYWEPMWSSLYWDGQIDEVRIWNYARTEAEIRKDMCRRLTGSEPGLVGYWRFDECSGNTVLDASGNGNNGTLY